MEMWTALPYIPTLAGQPKNRGAHISTSHFYFFAGRIKWRLFHFGRCSSLYDQRRFIRPVGLTGTGGRIDRATQLYSASRIVSPDFTYCMALATDLKGDVRDPSAGV